jgi:hypothetical protein
MGQFVSKVVTFETPPAGPEIKAVNVAKVGLKMSAKPGASVPKARGLRRGLNRLPCGKLAVSGIPTS